MKFCEYIKNRRVCFVGASPILVDRKMGEFIDSFDVVVRTNGSSTLINDPSFVKDYGCKMDVLYTNNQFYREMSPLPIAEYIKKNLKYLRMKTCKQKDQVHKVWRTQRCTSQGGQDNVPVRELRPERLCSSDSRRKERQMPEM